MTLPLTMLLALACAQSGPTTTRSITVDGHDLTVEVADSTEERAMGLMYRDSLPAEQGMLFVYSDTRVRSFWMKNTRIPLSIAFIDRAGTIVHIADMRPLDETPVSSVTEVPYALEMNQGWFTRNDVAVGDRVTNLPPLAGG